MNTGQKTRPGYPAMERAAFSPKTPGALFLSTTFPQTGCAEICSHQIKLEKRPKNARITALSSLLKYPG